MINEVVGVEIKYTCWTNLHVENKTRSPKMIPITERLSDFYTRIFRNSKKYTLL